MDIKKIGITVRNIRGWAANLITNFVVLTPITLILTTVYTMPLVFILI